MKKPSATGERIKKMLKAGMPPYVIREKLPGTESGRITYWRQRLGMPPFKRGARLKLAAWVKARKLRETGLTYQKIGDRMGVSRQRVHQYLTGYNSKKDCSSNDRKRRV
jgi:hypothetical protein